MSDFQYSMSDFIKEYKGDYNDEHETYVGLEFINGCHWIRLSREPNDNDRFYMIEMKLKDIDKPASLDNIEENVLGIYDTIEELLESTKVDGIKMKALLFDEKTEILSKD